MNFDEQMVVARIKRVTLRDLRFWVREGWVRPAHGEAGPVYDNVDIARIRLLCDLKKDMSLSSDALPVVLTLIDRLHETRRELRALKEALAHQPDDVRQTVVEKFHDVHDKSQETGGDPA